MASGVGHGHPMHVGVIKGVEHVVQFVATDDSFDQLHGSRI
jgi:hypothetical protein